MKKIREQMRAAAAYGFGPLTMVLIGICTVVFLCSISNYSINFRAVYSLFISVMDTPGVAGLHSWPAVSHRLIEWQSALPEVRQGQVWRLITPIFIHMSFPQFFFYLLFLRDLGSMVESRQGALTLLVLVLVFAVILNLAQYFMHGPAFGGMSGVTYALLGYVWVRGKIDPASGLVLHAATLAIMFVCFFVYLIGFRTGFIDTIATLGHLTGILTGVFWGGVSGLSHRLQTTRLSPGKMKKTVP